MEFKSFKIFSFNLHLLFYHYILKNIYFRAYVWMFHKVSSKYLNISLMFNYAKKISFIITDN